MTNHRLKVISRFLLLIGLLITVRLFYWQVVKGPQLAILADRQHQETIKLSAKRGEILDRSGYVLAGTQNLYQLSVYKPLLKISPVEIIEALVPTIAGDDTQRELTREFLRTRFSLKSNWISLKHYLTTGQKSQIEALKITGLNFDDEFTRTYPESSLSASLLGFVGKDQNGADKGYFGLEGYFNRELQGREGLTKMDKDAIGHPLLLGKFEKLDNLAGRDIGTTIDRRIQHLAETILSEGLQKYEATSGGVIIMESKTGKIRAMANLPSYDPRNFSQYDQSLYINTNVAVPFEPGSTFKVLIMASALNEGVIEPDTACDICAGPVNIGKYSIKTWNEQYYPQSTMTDVIRHSDNTGMVFVARKLGPEKLYEYLSKFGIGQKTGTQLEEEVSGNLKVAGQISEIDLATMSFGQGIALTPIQLVSAVNVIANRGFRVKPIIVDRLIEDNLTIADLTSPPSSPLLSPETIEEITRMMVASVEGGEAKWNKPKNIKIAGKTGTAQIPIEGHYDQEKTIASFIGFFPADDPRFTMLVTLKEPKTSPWGSETAAPLWFKLATQLTLYL